MKTLSIVKAGLGGGAVILLLSGVLAVPAAQASTRASVPCSGKGGGSAGLIAAINSANSTGGATINLAAGCTYTLTTADNSDPMLGANGLPVITSRITLNGFRTTIAGNDSNFRILSVAGSGNLTLQGLTITGGTTSSFGGGILNAEGTLTLNHSRVTGNATTDMMSAGGGIATGTNRTGLLGRTTLNFSQVDHNTTAGSAGGIVNHAGTLTLNASQVNDNTAAGGGGGIASGPGALGGPSSSILVLNFSQVDGNTSNGGPPAGAGGIANGGQATINASTVDGNTAPGAPGGGILNHGTMTITLSQVNGNTAPADNSGNQGAGGGIANHSFSLIGAPSDSGTLTITLSQVRNNTASGSGGGIVEDGINPDFTFGAPGGPLTLKLSTVTGNTAAQGGGIFASSGSPVTLKITAVIKNTPDNCSPLGSIPGCKN
jgi:hypothetical protein